jgi:hypothetical protein
MTIKIKFTDTIKGIPEEYHPVPAKKVLPEWYKNIPSYINIKESDLSEKKVATAKKCIPVYDAITAGYILYTPCDVNVTSKNGAPYYSWPDFDIISWHLPHQINGHPDSSMFPTPKWRNPWAIETPKGYSCMFLPPLHRESVFKIFEGVVDTDTFSNPVELPFTLNDPKWTGVIPAGTPMAQVIPFKRESYELEIGSMKDEKENQEILLRKLKSTFFNAYKEKFWTKKEYN